MYSQTKIIQAHHPRCNIDSTLSSNDILSIVYSVHYSTRKAKRLINLVFLHGSGMSRAVWYYHTEKLLSMDSLNINSIILIDQVNHGDSYLLNKLKLGPHYDWIDGARDVIKVMSNELSISNNNKSYYNIIIGHSMGGFQALSTIVLSPGLFQKCIVIEPVVITLSEVLFPKSDKTIIKKSFYDALFNNMNDTFDNISQFNDFIDNSSFYKNSSPIIKDIIKQYELLYSNNNNKIITKMNSFQNILCYLTNRPGSSWLLNNLSFINIPVISIWGKNSNWTPKQNLTTLQNNIPLFNTIIIDDADHLLNIELPDKLIDIIIDNLNDINNNNINTILLSDDERITLFNEKFNKFVNERIIDNYSKPNLKFNIKTNSKL